MHRKRRWLIATAIFLILILIIAGGIKYRVSYARTEVTASVSADRQHTLNVYMIGGPQWPFGPVRCELELTDGSKLITEHTFFLQNDGGPAHEDNFGIVWRTDSVQVTVSGEEQSDRIYILGL